MKYTVLKLTFLVNHILLILHNSWLINEGTYFSIESVAPFLISSLMLIDITYISSCNIRENKVISLFCALLALDSWYMLLSLEKNTIGNIAFTILSPIIWYVSVRFILMFLFQGTGYKFRKATNIIFLISCIGSLISSCISSKAFAIMYGIQFLVYLACFLFVVVYHWKRVAFVIKSEWKCIVISVVIISISFFIYYFATIEIENHISNFGVYIPVLLFFMSVHGIILKEHSSFPLSTVFSRRQIILIISLSLSVLGLITLFLGGGYEELLIWINVLFAFIYICNIFLGHNLKQGESRIIKESKYNIALRQLQQEELLKTEFANFLHDDVLQDLLSIKNMMNKVYRPDIQDIIIETLDSLNIHIRKEMQDYHPIILKNLTAKENYQNLLEAVSQSFPQRNIVVSLNCSDTLFLAQPYNILVYRLLKELLTNVYKHSDGRRAWVTLSQEKGMIELSVSDDGTSDAICLTSADTTKHKGIASINEQVRSMEGSVTIFNNIPHGICVHITIPMKGDVSYQYFIS